MFKNTPLWPVLLIALALRFPGWFTQDQKSKYELFEQDEFQYVEMAVSFLQELDASLFTDWEVEKYIYNVRGFGIQMGWLAYFYHKTTGAELDAATLIMIGRGLATAYALLLIVLVYRITRFLFQDRNVAWLAALLLAIFDLNVTYSHYGIPAISYVFWSYLTLFLLVKWYDVLAQHAAWKWPKWWLSVAIPFAAAATFATKFDFIPVLMAALSLLVLVYQKQVGGWKMLGFALGFAMLWVCFFALLTAFTLSFEEVRHSFDYLYRQNKDVIEQDHHLLYNPFLYLMAIIAGSSLPVFVAAVYGKLDLVRTRKHQASIFAFVFFLIFLALEFGVRWNIDTPFVRRVNIFLPAIAILGAYGGMAFAGKWGKKAKLIIGLIIAYTLAITLCGQYNAWNDTRYRARTYLNTQHPTAKVCYSYYVRIPGMPTPYLKKEADLLLLHETYYGRYWKYFASPFQYPPECCEEVYHCISGEAECLFYQNLLAGNDKEFELLKIIPTLEVMPERLFYKYLFGSYETFLGDVRIYRRKTN